MLYEVITHDHAVVALGFTLGIRIPFSDIAGACFEIHLGGQAITQINLATKRICSVLVPLDKARGYNVATGIDRFFALDSVLGDGNDLPIRITSYNVCYTKLLRDTFRRHRNARANPTAS